MIGMNPTIHKKTTKERNMGKKFEDYLVLGIFAIITAITLFTIYYKWQNNGTKNSIKVEYNKRR